MTAERYAQRLDDFCRALERLREALNAPDGDLVLDGTIQRFEFTFELAWKSVQLWLELQGVQAGTPRQALAAALEAGLIDDGNAWSELLRNRNLTSHTYDQTLALRIREFVRDPGMGLLSDLENRLKRPLPR